jgi:GTP1/Obg family GTP-binding protein
MIDNKLLEKISHENTEFHRLYQEIKTLNEVKNELPKIVVCGLLKAGKSSLLNVLTGHFDEEYFTTNAARATIKVKSFEIGGVIYIDTPGIDANKEDDIEAWNGLIDADIILFAHNLREGNIVTSEKQFIKQW